MSRSKSRPDPVMAKGKHKPRELLKRRRQRILLVAAGCSLMVACLWILDRCFPLALPPAASGFYAQVVYDRDGRPLRAFADERGIWRYRVSLDEVSPYYLDALLNYEDRRFWHHPGVDPLALIRATWLNLTQGRVVSGGSTLSMQVARLLHPHSRSLAGKLYQVVRTLQLEWHLSKTQILELYCNIAPFGGTIEGVQAASHTYLGKPASELTRAEAALMAVLPQSPTRLRPDIHPLAAERARDKVLDRLQAFGEWSSEDIAQAKLETVYGVRHTPEQHAPLLARRLAQAYPQLQRINTTIDGDLQRSLETYLKSYVVQQAEKSSAAALVMENKTQRILAYVGTADFASQQRYGHVDMVTATRSPGSTLKPFLYGLALDEGLIHSESLLVDAPRHWQDYRPGNFSGGFSGPVSAADALQRSLNIPAVGLLDRYGPANFVARLANAGVPLAIPGDKANLAVILGGVGLSLESLVAAYGSLANGGQVSAPRYLAAEKTAAPRYLMSPQAAWVIQKILADIPPPNGLRYSSALAKGATLAWKTGTSYGFRDSWAIGVGRHYTIGVWFGRPDGTPLPGASGRASAGPLLHGVADMLPGAREPLPRPTGVTDESVCWPLGRRVADTPAAQCHATRDALVINGTVPPTLWDEQSEAVNPRVIWLDSVGNRVHSGCGTQFSEARKTTVALWPLMGEPWVAPQWQRARQLPDWSRACVTTLDLDSPVRITGIDASARYRRAGAGGANPRLTLAAVGGSGDRHWYLDGQYYRSAASAAALAVELNSAGEHQILVIDDVGNTDQVWVRVE
ncbi:penicillin-binding protein 1C [Teredinibacter turnerae]|uniref:penicillin-binding protein 1C n=1 Tax=Teredinibacter turnerae TaxID=2426 RepID=UPI001E31735D|nr:penicillin-binding protein 1C [Teredinibacter turnerae]